MDLARDSLTHAPEMAATLPSRAGAAMRARTMLVVRSALVVVVYVALDAASSVFPHGPIPVTPWNPQAGFALAVVIAGGRRYLPATVLAAIGAEALLRASNGPAFWVMGGVCAGLGYALSGIAFQALGRGRSLARMEPLRDLLIVALLGTAVAAAAYTLAFSGLEALARTMIPSVFLRKWLGDYVGVVALAPFLLALIDRRVWHRRRRAVALDALVFSLCLLALLLLVFAQDATQGHKLRYLLFVPLLYLAMRHDFVGAAFGVACTQFALFAALLASGGAADDATDYELLMVVLGATTLLLGSATHERRRALAKLAQHDADLRAQHAALSDAMRVAVASETASTLAHEMSQPLSAIGTYARAGIEMLRRGTAGPGDIASVLERIERETTRSSTVVRRVRDFFRNGASRRELTDVAGLARDAVEGVRDRLALEHVDIELDAPAGLPYADVDPVQIGTVMHSLLGNAIDALAASSGARRIRVAVRTNRSREIEVDIEDSGPGVAESVAASLFEPLSTTKPAGMGLGLAICRTIVQAHGGTLCLASHQPTLFRFTLPIHGQEHS